MVAEMPPTGQNESWFDLLDQLVNEVNQSHLEEVQGDPDNAQIVKGQKVIKVLPLRGRPHITSAAFEIQKF